VLTFDISDFILWFSGSAIAIACSYLYEQEENDANNSENNIFIQFVTDQETKPK
jgi:cell cycle arrest protein BUB3